MVSVIAEIGSVHDGSFGNAIKLIEAVAATGANAVKFQLHIAEAETLENAPSPAYFSAEPRFDYFKRTSFTKEQWAKLYTAAKDNKLEFWVSPFSNEAVDILEQTGIDGYKIASGEVTNIPLLHKIAQTQKSVMLSSGMSNWTELNSAVSALSQCADLTILQCSSIYPCPPEQVGLNVLTEMRERFQRPVGYSDHTTGFAAAIAMVAMGAVMVEKHFTFSRLMYGSDAANAMEPNDFKHFVSMLKETAIMRDSKINKDNLNCYANMKSIFEKSIVSACDLAAGEILTMQHLAFKKPGTGLPAHQFNSVIGKRVARNIEKNTLIKQEDLV